MCSLLRADISAGSSDTVDITWVKQTHWHVAWDDLNFVTWCFILPAVHIRRSSLWSKDVAFTLHWHLKHWHKSGLIPTSKSCTPNFDPSYWMWRSKFNPIQPASFFNFLSSRFFHDPVEIVSIFPSSWMRGTLNAVQLSASAAAHLVFMFSFRCVQRRSTIHLSCQEYFELGSNQPGDTPLTAGINAAVPRENCRLLDIFFLLFSLKPREILICSLWNLQTSLSGATTMPHLL